MQPSPSLISAVADELRVHAPFDAMSVEHLRWLAERMSLRYFAKGATLLSPTGESASTLFLIQRGEVHGSGSHENRDERAVVLTVGEMFPIGALIGCRPTVLTFVATTDVFCYTLPLADFEQLMDVSAPFRHFATRRLSHLLDQSRKAAQSAIATTLSDTSRLSRPLREVIRRAPISVADGTSVEAVLKLMREERIGAVLIVDEANHARGIFTERDVLTRVAVRDFDQSQSISLVMTRNPITLPQTATLFDAARLMMERQFRHVVVTEASGDGAVMGVVSERDLFSLQQRSVGSVAKAVHRAATREALVLAALEVRNVAESLIAQGVSAEQVTGLVTTLNDAILTRTIELVSGSFTLPSCEWCWLGLGSEGRMEQTLATDQDNAIVFEPLDGEAVQAQREQFLAFAAEVNRLLAECGFPLCKGGVMASNPKWCLTAAEWQSRFSDWMRDKNPESLLFASIFFDFRPLYGINKLADRLRTWLTPVVAKESLFLHLMAMNAVSSRPPLSLLGGLVGSESGTPGMIDLKRFGVRPFVDAARTLALQHSVPQVSTVERLRAVATRSKFASGEMEAVIESFHFIQSLRLRQFVARSTADPIADARGEPVARHDVSPNHVRIDALNPLDQRILKEAFRHVRNLQARIELDFRV